MDTVTLYNMALDHVGGTRIQSADEDGNAAICRDFEQIVVDNGLEKFDWTFARAFQDLTYRMIANPDYDPLDPNSPATIPETTKDWAYTYDLPNDFLCIRVVDNHTNDEFEPLMATICSNSDEMSITYTSALRIIENFPNPFSEAISFLLAYYICTRVSGFNPEMKSFLLQQYDVFLRIAKQHDSKRRTISVQGEYTLVEE